MRKLFQKFYQMRHPWLVPGITFTALQSLRRRDLTLRGVTSLWMFPIYGAGCLLTPRLSPVPGAFPDQRGFLYALFILAGEYVSGSLLRKKASAPGITERPLERGPHHPAGLYPLLGRRGPSDGTRNEGRIPRPPPLTVFYPSASRACAASLSRSIRFITER